MNQVNEYRRLRQEMSLDSVSLGYCSVTIFTVEVLEKSQLGYSVDPKGNDLTGTQAGDWSKNWFVIGYEDMTGDPIFIDFGRKDFPVYTAIHGIGAWNENLLAPSLASFALVLEIMRKISIGRENPVALKKNPVSLLQRLMAIYRIRIIAPGSSVFFWWSWMKS